MADIHQKLQEEKILRSIRAKRRFRAAVRHVIYNIAWLDEDEDKVDPGNVKQTLSRLTRRKTGKAKGLSIREKAVLRKKLEYRTDTEKQFLNKYIGGLKCFRKYPESVQLELVGVTYFEYYGPGRVLVRQDDDAHAMYFLLSGEVVVTKKQWDQITNEYTYVELGRITAGSMFGEVSLLHNVQRTATVTTTQPCEVLVLKREDFDRVLKTRLMQRWDSIREAMDEFIYFAEWDSVTIRECCILSKIKNYEPNEIVFGDGRTRKGVPDMSYFLIEGTCAVIEHLFIEETKKRGIKYYKLYELIDDEVLDSQSYIEGLDYEKNFHSIDRRVTKKVQSLTLKLVDSSNAEEIDDDKSELLVDPQKLLRRESTDKSLNQIHGLMRSSTKSLRTVKMVEGKSSILKSSFEKKRINNMSIMSYKKLLQKEKEGAEDNIYQRLRDTIPSNVKLRFMQICTLGPRATFMEGELMKNRRVIALTPAKFLLIPTYWLIQHNKGNMWTRVERFIYSRIPSREQVFKAYISNNKWKEYKRKLRDEILSKRRVYNNTTIHDVPYSIRVVNNYE